MYASMEGCGAALSAQELEHIYGADSEHPELPREDWRDCVARRDTVQGYWCWVAAVLCRTLDNDWEGEPS